MKRNQGFEKVNRLFLSPLLRFLQGTFFFNGESIVIKPCIHSFLMKNSFTRKKKKKIDETNSNQWTLLEVPFLKTSKLRPLTDSPSWSPWMTGISPKSRVQQVTGMLTSNAQNYTQTIYRQVSGQLEMSDTWIWKHWRAGIVCMKFLESTA